MTNPRQITNGKRNDPPKITQTRFSLQIPDDKRNVTPKSQMQITPESVEMNPMVQALVVDKPLIQLFSFSMEK